MEKVWLKSYEQDVPTEIDINEYSSITDLFEKTCQKYANSTAFINMKTKMSYQRLDKLSLQFAGYLMQTGLPPGSRIAIMLPNTLQYPIALFGALRAGFVVVNTNPLYTAEELAYQLNNSGAQVIIVLEHFAKTLHMALPKLPLLKHIVITKLGDIFSFPKRILVNLVIKYIKKMIPPYHIPQALFLNTALKRGKRYPADQLPKQNHQSLAFLQYTGGTTGVSKAAMLTHGNIIANIIQAGAWIAPLAKPNTETIITALPLYHIFSLTANCFTFLKLGATNILITNPRDISSFISEIRHTQFTAITGVNTLFNALLNHSQFSTVDFSKLKLTLSGGMALQKSIAERWQKQTGAPILEAYGLTETSPALTMNPILQKQYNGSIGLPISSTDVSIRDNLGIEQPLNQPGELCVKGPQVMKGYWQREDETELVFWPDGFLRTGDIVMMNDAGYLFLLDRKKDMILVSGFNVYPNEIEQIISQHPGVQEVGVIGIKDESANEKVKACIVKRDQNLTAEDIIAHCRVHLTAYKIPKIVQFYTDLPKNNVGKVLRRELR